MRSEQRGLACLDQRARPRLTFVDQETEERPLEEDVVGEFVPAAFNDDVDDLVPA